ncbi:MAG: matrixin family metalloprotease [bacterium]
MPHSKLPIPKQKQKRPGRGRRLIVLILIGISVYLAPQAVLAYNYAGYRWGGSWPQVTVDYSGVAVNAWRIRLQNTMNDWNATGAKFTFQSGSSNNDVTVYYQNSSTLASTTVYRKYGAWGNIVRVTEKINNYHDFSPPQNTGYDFSTVMRHEYGHWLKLNHTNPPSLMQSNIGRGEIRYVASDDRNAIRAIYGVR